MAQLQGKTDDHEFYEFLKSPMLKRFEGQRQRGLAAIHLAAADGQTDMIVVFHKYHAQSIDIQNDKCDTPILWAARWDKIDTVKTLMRLGAQPNTANDKKSTALYWAVRYGLANMTKVILSNANTDDERRSLANFRRDLGFELPIILASALGYTDIIVILKQHGADVNARRSGGSTALHLAASIGRDEVIRVLLDSGADIEARDDAQNTPLLLAVKHNRLSATRELISAGADTDISNMLGHSIWDKAMECDELLMLKTVLELCLKRSRQRRDSKRSVLTFKDGRSPLHVAASCGDVQKVKVILAAGVPPDYPDQHKNTFLHIAARDNNIDVRSPTRVTRHECIVNFRCLFCCIMQKDITLVVALKAIDSSA